jgi:Protein of unknown function (DUF2958)
MNSRHDALRGHSLMPPPTTLAKVPPLYGTERVAVANKMVRLHYFIGNCNWWIVELDPKEGLAFGYANLGNDDDAEWGYVDLGELSEICLDRGLAVVQRDLHWIPKRFGEIDTHSR